MAQTAEHRSASLGWCRRDRVRSGDCWVNGERLVSQFAGDRATLGASQTWTVGQSTASGSSPTLTLSHIDPCPGEKAALRIV